MFIVAKVPNKPPTMAVFFIVKKSIKMRYKNTRYGNPEELRHYVEHRSISEVAKSLKRSERSIKDWLNGVKKMPFWVPELLRLRDMEKAQMLRSMGIRAPLPKNVIDLDLERTRIIKDRARRRSNPNAFECVIVRHNKTI